MPITPSPEDQSVWTAVEEIIARLRGDDQFNTFGKAHIDWWWEQPFFEGEEYPYGQLTLYVEANVVETKDEGRIGIQLLTTDFTVYMEWRSNADSHDGAVSKDNFLAFQQYPVAIHRRLHGYQGANMNNKLHRVGGPRNVPGIERKGVLIAQTYRCNVRDCTGVPARTFETPSGVQVNAEEVNNE
jgi:hypothetical protein